MYNIPIVVLFFNQPKRLQSLLTMLSTIEPKTLILIQNGPSSVEDVPKVYACQEVIKSFAWKGKVISEFLPKKVDDSAFISSSMLMSLRFVERAIFLTEDAMPTLAFFEYMTFMAESYQDDPRIFVISGTTRVKFANPSSYYFSKFTSTAAFMTFKRAIENYTLDITVDFKNNKEIFKTTLNNKIMYKFLCEKLNESIHCFNENQNPPNWSYTFLFYLLINNGLTIFPKYNLVSHPQNPITEKMDISSLQTREIVIDDDFEKAYTKVYFKKKTTISRLFFRKKTHNEV